MYSTRDKVLLICMGCILLSYATEITKNGVCPSEPNLKPQEDAALSMLDGFYYGVASYSQNPSTANRCYRFRFTPRSENVTDVTMRYKSSFLGLPGQTDYFIKGTANNGSYTMNTNFIVDIYIGQMYVLGTMDNVTVIYTCKKDAVLDVHVEDVFVLSENSTYPTAQQEFVKETLKNNTLDFGFVRQVQQETSNCANMITA